MRMFVSYFRSMVISIEFAICIWAAGLIWINPNFAGEALAYLRDPQEASQWASLVPATMLGLTFRTARSFLFPSSDKRGLFSQWEHYYQAKATFYAALSYSILFCALAWTAWIINSAAYLRYGGVLNAAGLLGSLVTYITTYLAEIRINELLADSVPQHEEC